ncbi:3'-5' exonuclease [Candidatus Peribacteria bacterium]|nr:3'-5' exonuclease [Candidatus Peribacteria bacterium]
MPLPSFTVFDTETTGLDPQKGHKIIEIAGVRIENGEIQDETTFMELVNPERDIPLEARQINRIQEEDVRLAPTIDQILPRFLEFAQGSILVAHNAAFDMRFLEREKQLCWGYVELPECLCTLCLSRTLYPTEFRHNLDALTRRFGLTMPEARHRALPDVLLTAQCLLRMMREHDIATIEQLREKAEYHAGIVAK